MLRPRASYISFITQAYIGTSLWAYRVCVLVYAGTQISLFRLKYRFISFLGLSRYSFKNSIRRVCLVNSLVLQVKLVLRCDNALSAGHEQDSVSMGASFE